MAEPEYKQKTIEVNKFEANDIIRHLYANYGRANDGIFDMKERGKIKIQSHEGKTEVMCNCDEKVLNELEELIEQNE